MKNLSIKIIFLAVFAFIIFFGGTALVKSTEDDKFCTVCHGVDGPDGVSLSQRRSWRCQQKWL